MADLIDAGKGQVEPTLEAICQQHRQGLFTLALAITRCPARAEDAVQEAFARLWTSGVEASVAYVFTAVRNAAIDQVRRRRPMCETPASLFDSHSSDPLGAAMGAEQQELVRRGVDELPDEQREVLVLRVYAGLTFQEIAEVLGEPLQTVASRYRRTLERLREKLQPLAMQ